jgi:hypothetical protein
MLAAPVVDRRRRHLEIMRDRNNRVAGLHTIKARRDSAEYRLDMATFPQARESPFQQTASTKPEQHHFDVASDSELSHLVFLGLLVQSSGSVISISMLAKPLSRSAISAL